MYNMYVSVPGMWTGTADPLARTRTGPGLDQDWTRTGPGPDQDRTRTGPGQDKDWTRTIRTIWTLYIYIYIHARGGVLRAKTCASKSTHEVSKEVSKRCLYRLKGP